MRVICSLYGMRPKCKLELQMQCCVQSGLHSQRQVLRFSATNSEDGRRSPLLRTLGTGNISDEGGSLVSARPQRSTRHCLLRQLFRQLVFPVSLSHLEMMTCLNHRSIHLVFSASSNSDNRQHIILKMVVSACV